MPKIKIIEGEGREIEVEAPENWVIGAVVSVGSIYKDRQGQPQNSLFVQKESRVGAKYVLPPKFEMNFSIEGLSGQGEVIGRANFVGLGSGRRGFSDYEDIKAGEKRQSRRGAVWIIGNKPGQTSW